MTDHSTSRDDTFNTPSFPTISDYDGLGQNFGTKLTSLMSEDSSFYLTGFKFKIAAENKS